MSLGHLYIFSGEMSFRSSTHFLVGLFVFVFVFFDIELHESESISQSVMSESLGPHGLLPTRLLCP